MKKTTKAGNERFTGVRLGTPLGEMLQEFGTPKVRSAALEADGAPKRVRLLGKKNIGAFRATEDTWASFARALSIRIPGLTNWLNTEPHNLPADILETV